MNYKLLKINNNNNETKQTLKVEEKNNNNQTTSDNSSPIGKDLSFMDKDDQSPIPTASSSTTSDDHNSNREHQQDQQDGDCDLPITSVFEDSTKNNQELSETNYHHLTLRTSTTTTTNLNNKNSFNHQRKHPSVEMRMKSPPSSTTPVSSHAPPAAEENIYIKSDKVHMHHGRPTHYYRDQPKQHEMLLSVKVLNKWNKSHKIKIIQAIYNPFQRLQKKKRSRAIRFEYFRQISFLELFTSKILDREK